jgi:hypothetical protein
MDSVRQREVEVDSVLFLRRARLAGYFLLGIEEAVPSYGKEFPDWDALLSSDSLETYFNVPIANVDVNLLFTPYRLIELPGMFLEFGREDSFNIPVWDLVNSSYLCLHTGVYLSAESDMSEYFETRRGDPTVMLAFGPRASSLNLRIGKKDYMLMSFYLDRFGVPDHGLLRNQVVTLCHEAYECLVEILLSGSFAQFI